MEGIFLCASTAISGSEVFSGICLDMGGKVADEIGSLSQGCCIWIKRGVKGTDDVRYALNKISISGKLLSNIVLKILRPCYHFLSIVPMVVLIF